jgi:hypothetical protein
MEERMTRTFRIGIPMRDIIAEANTITGPVTVKGWAA